MKTTFLSLFTCAALLFVGCNKSNPTPNKQPEVPVSTKTTPEASIYVNDFATILGNTASEDSLLDWSIAQGFTQINLYNIGTILGSTTTKNQLNSFVGKAHGSPYYLSVGFIAAGSTTAGNIDTYCQNYANIPDAIISEYEFWNTGFSFSGFIPLQTGMNNVHSTTASVDRITYVSKFTDKAGVYHTDSICRSLINNNETIFLVNYSTNAYNLSATLTGKLQQLANNAQALGKVADIVILFNVNTSSSDPNIYNYFSTTGLNHPFADAFTNLMSGYASSAITNKAHLNIKGYSIYRYSNAASARP